MRSGSSLRRMGRPTPDASLQLTARCFEDGIDRNTEGAGMPDGAGGMQAGPALDVVR